MCSPPLGTIRGEICYPQVPFGHPRLSMVCPLRGRVVCGGILLSAGDPSASSGITLRLLLTCDLFEVFFLFICLSFGVHFGVHECHFLTFKSGIALIL